MFCSAALGRKLPFQIASAFTLSDRQRPCRTTPKPRATAPPEPLPASARPGRAVPRRSRVPNRHGGRSPFVSQGGRAGGDNRDLAHPERSRMRPIILVGDRTSHGGVVIDGAPESDVGGKPIARVGNHATCPIKGHGKVTVIVSGDPTLIVDGAAVARHGDKTACGATLLSSQVTT
jgi:uncharacterized Zn-binding protein involved in type VI secretion